MCSPLSDGEAGRKERRGGGAQTESSRSVREMKIWMKFKRKREALIKLFLVRDVCVCVSEIEQGGSSFAMTIYPLLSRCRLTCRTLPTSASLWFFYSNPPPPPNKGKEVSFFWCQAEQRHRMKQSFVAAFPFVHIALKTPFLLSWYIPQSFFLCPCRFLFPK